MNRSKIVVRSKLLYKNHRCVLLRCCFILQLFLHILLISQSTRVVFKDSWIARRYLASFVCISFSGVSSRVKLATEVPHIPNSECSAVYGKVGKLITARQLCAGGVAGKDSCSGDSGGPLMTFKNDDQV